VFSELCLDFPDFRPAWVETALAQPVVVANLVATEMAMALPVHAQVLVGRI
jgi:hypothetical protein